MPTRKVRRNSLDRKQILLRLKQHEAALKKYSVTRIGLFGSYARGQQRRTSDIDFLVEFRKPTFDNFMGLIDYLEKLFGASVDVLTPDGVDSIRVESVKEDIRKTVVYA